MKRSISIQLKAALLLIVFGLNTVVGFACAMDVDMGFNTTHHHHDEEASEEVHLHSNGEKHEHHNKSANHQHEENNKESKEKDGCCNDSVIKLSQTEKSVPQPNIVVSPVFFTAFIASYYNIDILYPSQVSGSVKYFVRSHHPPIPDTRIAIQSFQI